MNINIKYCYIKSATQKNELVLRINNNLTDETYRYLNPENDQADGLDERAIDGCEQFFHS